jgi:lipoprotein-anchoring transpeptidase ErfK/SrfK
LIEFHDKKPTLVLQATLPDTHGQHGSKASTPLALQIRIPQPDHALPTSHTQYSRAAIVAAGFLLAACSGSSSDSNRVNPPPDSGVARMDSGLSTRAADNDSAAAASGPDSADIRFEVDLTARVVRVLGVTSDTLAVHPVAIGSIEWPTQKGSWAINQVVLNPEWIPPDESWAEEREPRKPGDPQNPLGRAQLVYDMPRTIHGTNQPASVGKAVSHGSIRVTNTVALALANMVLERTGVDSASDLMARAAAKRSEKHIITLTRVVPIRVF